MATRPLCLRLLRGGLGDAALGVGLGRRRRCLVRHVLVEAGEDGLGLLEEEGAEDEPEHQEAEDAAHDDQPEIDSRPPPRLVFIAALIANGWFLGVKSFLYSPGAASPPKRFAAAFKRWILFFAFWIAAVVLLPITPVVAAFACWLTWIVRDVRTTISSLDVQEEIKATQ